MRPLLLVLFLAISCGEASAASFFVSSAATPFGDGSRANPWRLQTALDHPATLLPGDTVWVRGGVYTNRYDATTSFSCRTHGTMAAPIIFRNYNNERATIDGEQTYSLYLGLGSCSNTWFWGLEVTNSRATDRNREIGGSITCTAEHITFINMIIHDMGSGLDCWKTALNCETYGCLIYHIGNNLNNNGNWEGHGHGMYLQNDTMGIKRIHNNIVFSTYGYGIKVWQTTTTAAIGNFDIQHTIVFNGGAASENLGGVGNNYRTHNFFVVSNGPDNPVSNTVIKHNYTYSGSNTPRPPVNAFGLNYGVKNMVLDSNFFTGQTRLGFSNTPVFEASVKGNTFLGGIPPVYGIYLWGFTQADYPQNRYIPDVPRQGLEYVVIPNAYEKGRAHLAIYNWDSAATVRVNIASVGLHPGDRYELVNVMDYFNDIATGVVDASGIISVPMTGHTFAAAVGSTKAPVSQFPVFGVFVLRRQASTVPVGIGPIVPLDYTTISPNPSTGKFILHCGEDMISLSVWDIRGEKVYDAENSSRRPTHEIDLSAFPKGLYMLRILDGSGFHSRSLALQ